MVLRGEGLLLKIFSKKVSKKSFCDQVVTGDRYTEYVRYISRPKWTINTPVSYTHLDVYKRQALDRERQKAVETLEGAVFPKKEPPKPRLHTNCTQIIFPYKGANNYE